MKKFKVFIIIMYLIFSNPTIILAAELESNNKQENKIDNVIDTPKSIMIGSDNSENGKLNEDKSNSKEPTITSFLVSGDVDNTKTGIDFYKNINIHLIGDNLTDKNFLTKEGLHWSDKTYVEVIKGSALGTINDAKTFGAQNTPDRDVVAYSNNIGDSGRINFVGKTKSNEDLDLIWTVSASDKEDWLKNSGYNDNRIKGLGFAGEQFIPGSTGNSIVVLYNNSSNLSLNYKIVKHGTNEEMPVILSFISTDIDAAQGVHTDLANIVEIIPKESNLVKKDDIIYDATPGVVGLNGSKDLPKGGYLGAGFLSSFNYTFFSPAPERVTNSYLYPIAVRYDIFGSSLQANLFNRLQQHIKIDYVDDLGNKIKDSEFLLGFQDEKYNFNSINIPKYKLINAVKDESNKNYPVVKFIYSPTYTVTLEFVDEQGKKLLDSEKYTVIKDYNLSYKAKDIGNYLTPEILKTTINKDTTYKFVYKNKPIENKENKTDNNNSNKNSKDNIDNKNKNNSSDNNNKNNNSQNNTTNNESTKDKTPEDKTDKNNSNATSNKTNGISNNNQNNTPQNDTTNKTPENKIDKNNNNNSSNKTNTEFTNKIVSNDKNKIYTNKIYGINLDSYNNTITNKTVMNNNKNNNNINNKLENNFTNNIPIFTGIVNNYYLPTKQPIFNNNNNNNNNSNYNKVENSKKESYKENKITDPFLINTGMNEEEKKLFLNYIKEVAKESKKKHGNNQNKINHDIANAIAYAVYADDSAQKAVNDFGEKPGKLSKKIEDILNLSHDINNYIIDFPHLAAPLASSENSGLWREFKKFVAGLSIGIPWFGISPKEVLFQMNSMTGDVLTKIDEKDRISNIDAYILKYHPKFKDISLENRIEQYYHIENLDLKRAVLYREATSSQNKNPLVDNNTYTAALIALSALSLAGAFLKRNEIKEHVNKKITSLKTNILANSSSKIIKSYIKTKNLLLPNKTIKATKQKNNIKGVNLNNYSTKKLAKTTANLYVTKNKITKYITKTAAKTIKTVNQIKRKTVTYTANVVTKTVKTATKIKNKAINYTAKAIGHTINRIYSFNNKVSNFINGSKKIFNSVKQGVKNTVNKVTNFFKSLF